MSISASIVVRNATEDDIRALIPLLAQLFEIEKDFSFCERKQWAGLKLLLEQHDACILVAEVGGKIRGMCTVQLVVSTAEGAYSGWVEDMVVHQCWRGIGIGKQLLQAAEAWAVRKGATRLQLLADQENRSALLFYRGTGWEATQLTALRHHLPERSDSLVR